MSDNKLDLLTRLEQLESENRRMKRVGTALFSCLGLGLLVGFAAPRICDTISAERFLVKDSRGKTRIMLNAYSTDAPSITWSNAKGKQIATLSLDSSDEMNLEVFKDGKSTKRSFSTEGPAAPTKGRADSNPSIN